jgi:ACDE family multidrug resistance protein
MAEIAVYRDRSFQIASIASFLGFMMVALITPAFPKMVQALGVAEQSIGLIITANTIPAIIISPLSGIMADRFGRKRVLVPSIFLFGIAGGSCAFTSDFNTILILRLVQGIGGAALFNTSIVIVGDIFAGQRRAEAMGLNNTINYVGYIIYPVLGGALASIAWNYTFLPLFLNIPLGIIAQLYLDYPESNNQQTFKQYLGDSLHYLKSLKVLWLFLAAIITYILFYGAYLTYFGLLLGNRFQASPFTIGLFVSVVGLIIAITSSRLGVLSKRFLPTLLLMIAFGLYAIAMFIIPVLSDMWLLLLPTVILGIAQGLITPSMAIMASSMTPPEHRAGFMAIFGAMIMLGMTIAPLVMGLAFTLTGLNLNATFIIAGIIALIIPVTAIAIGRKRLPLAQATGDSNPEQG